MKLYKILRNIFKHRCVHKI